MAAIFNCCLVEKNNLFAETSILLSEVKTKKNLPPSLKIKSCFISGEEQIRSTKNKNNHN